MQELDELVGAGANFLHLGGLFDRIEIVTHVVHTAAGRRDDIIEAGKIPHEQRFRRGAVGVEPAVRHRLSATGLVAGIDDLVTEPLQQLQCRDADFRKEGIDVARDEQPDAHFVTLRSDRLRSVVSRAPPSLSLVFEMARAGLSPLGRVLVQFMMVWQR